MGSRWPRVFTEAYRFLAVGGVATVIAFVIFNFLLHGFGAEDNAWLDGQPYLAYVLANVVGMLVSYRGSRTWAFRDRPPRSADGGRTAFVAINLLTMAIPIACLWATRNLLGLDDAWSDNVSANGIGLFLGLIARFYLFRTFVFQRPVDLGDLMHHPLQVLEMSELPDADGEPVSDSTGWSTSDRARRPAP